MSNDFYGFLIEKLVHRGMRFEEQSDIFRKTGIPKNSYHNVINPNRFSSGKDENGNPKPYETSVGWVVRLTNYFEDYWAVKVIAKDCNGVFLSNDEIEELAQIPPVEIVQKLLGMVKK
jgi:hypothetical protein